MFRYCCGENGDKLYLTKKNHHQLITKSADIHSTVTVTMLKLVRQGTVYVSIQLSSSLLAHLQTKNGIYWNKAELQQTGRTNKQISSIHIYDFIDLVCKRYINTIQHI